MSEAARDGLDAVIAAYGANVDRTLIAANLRRTPQERFDQLTQMLRFAEELRRAGERARTAT